MRGKIERNKIAAALLLCAVAIFFVSCEKEVLRGTGKPVEVRFTLGGVNYGDGGRVTRSASGGLAEETVVVPLDEDYCFYATLKENEASDLRASTLTAGTLLRIVAFKGGVDQGSFPYQVAADGTTIEPVGGTTGLVLPEDVYTFVAYSYNSTTVTPDYSSPVTDVVVSPEYDLLWGDAKNVDITGGADVGIVLYHKFSQVSVSATTAAISGTPAITAITDFTVSPGYKATLTVADGGIAKEGTDVTQTLSPAWDDLNSKTVTSASGCIVYTAGEQPVSVTIGSVTMGSVTYLGTVAKFAMPLVLGKEYTLVVDFKRNLKWAASNIYWVWVDDSDPEHEDGGYLTFKGFGYGENERYYQGVFFKWGSLVGISPAVGIPTSLSYYTGNTYVYMPTFTSSSNHSWSSLILGDEWNDIEPVGDNVSDNRFSTYLMDDARNTANDYAYWKDLKGDICRYISENGYGPGDGNYRMPTSYEMGAYAGGYSYGTNGWTKTGTWETGYTHGATQEGPDGTRVISVYAANSNGNVIFPVSGYRNDIGDLFYTNMFGVYWSGSPYSATDGWYFYCIQNYVNPAHNYDRNCAFSVRCVKNE